MSPYDDENIPAMVGKQIGNYEATKMLGKGSMGEVYMGAHPILDKQVAIKVLSEELSAYPELVSRFKREARAIARIKHDAIVQAFDFGNLPDGRQYYVMELLKGSNLAVYMAAKGPLPWNECMAIAIPLLEGLAAAHEAGFIHRDIKPDNIFLTRLEDGTLYPKIIDFGIAKLKDPDDNQDSVVTRIDAVMGTPLYMSPEQAPGSTEEVGPWSDIYSAAATLYHMMAGKPPFYSDNPLELMLMHSWQPPPPIYELRSDLSLEISDAIMKALAKKPAERYPSMQAFAEALKAVAEGRSPNAATEDAEDAGEQDETVQAEAPAALAEAVAKADAEALAEASAAAQEPPTDPPAPAEPASAADDDGGAEAADLEALEEEPRPKTTLTTHSGAAAEKVIDARLPTGTYFAQKKSSKSWVWIGLVVAAVAAAVIVFVATRGNNRTPPPAKSAPTFRQLSSSTRHTCAVSRDDTTVWCWGRNNYGQLGTGDKSAHNRPTLVVGLKDAVAVSAGGRHTCAVAADGAVWCWGKNDAGQLGDGTKQNRSKPVRVTGLGPAKAVGTGAAHSCALTRDGAVWCWGNDASGQLGDGTKQKAQPKPLRAKGLAKVSGIALGGFHTCAVGPAAKAWCWGKNDVGQLGVGDTAPRLLPTAVAGPSGPVTVLTAAGAHTCALSKGEVWCWGNNASGQLGDGTTKLRFTPVKAVGPTNVIQISAGGGYLGGHTCSTGSDGGVWCWGNNLSGQLGLSTPKDTRLKPRRLELVDSVAAVEAGGRHTCALRQEGDVRCWGRNTDGQLGDGTTIDRPKPTHLKP